jgi:hypothetical protein
MAFSILGLTPLLLLVSMAASIPSGLGLVLLFFSCSLLRAAHIHRHSPFVGAPPWVCFCDWWSLLIITGSYLEGWTSVLTSAWWVGLEPIPTRLSTIFRDFSSPTTMTLSHWAAALLLLHLWLCSGTSSSSSQTMWCLKSTDVSQVYRISSRDFYNEHPDMWGAPS